MTIWIDAIAGANARILVLLLVPGQTARQFRFIPPSDSGSRRLNGSLDV